MSDSITAWAEVLEYLEGVMVGPFFRLTRRQVLGIMSLVAGSGCLAPTGNGPSDDDGAGPQPKPGPPPGGFSDNLDALLDVLLPAERDAQGLVVAPGAREVGAATLLDFHTFVPLAQTQGLVPALPDEIAALLDDFDTALRATLNADLDLLAGLQEPLTAFRDLSRDRQEAVVDEAFADPTRAPLYAVVRAAAFAAYLGAGTSDAGLVAVGHPAFEDYAGGIAVSGYPRQVDGVLEDYTYNLAPEPTHGVDLGVVLDQGGDLL